jgi:hypothetical protein
MNLRFHGTSLAPEATKEKLGARDFKGHVGKASTGQGFDKGDQANQSTYV